MGIDFTAALCILTVSGQEASKDERGLVEGRSQSGPSPPSLLLLLLLLLQKPFCRYPSERKMTGTRKEGTNERRGEPPEKKHKLDWKLD